MTDNTTDWADEVARKMAGFFGHDESLNDAANRIRATFPSTGRDALSPEVEARNERDRIVAVIRGLPNYVAVNDVLAAIQPKKETL